VEPHHWGAACARGLRRADPQHEGAVVLRVRPGVRQAVLAPDLLCLDLDHDPRKLYSRAFTAGAWQDQYQFAVPAADLPLLCKQEPTVPASLAHPAIPVPPGRPKHRGARAKSAMDGNETSGRAPCGKCSSWAHTTAKCFQCTRCLSWGHQHRTCRTGLPGGFAYIAHVKRQRPAPVSEWDSEVRAGRKKAKSGGSSSSSSSSAM
jgi:hypothetical protein